MKRETMDLEDNKEDIWEILEGEKEYRKCILYTQNKRYHENTFKVFQKVLKNTITRFCDHSEFEDNTSLLFRVSIPSYNSVFNV